MSDYFDLFLSVELQPDLPDDVMHELKWHLGLVNDRPLRFLGLPDDDWYVDEPFPFFGATGESHAFNGVDVAAMIPATLRSYADGRQRWLLTLRQCVHEDELAFALELVAWIASCSTTTGWIGFLGHTATPAPDLMYHVGGHLEFSKPGTHRPFGTPK